MNNLNVHGTVPCIYAYGTPCTYTFGTPVYIYIYNLIYCLVAIKGVYHACMHAVKLSL